MYKLNPISLNSTLWLQCRYQLNCNSYNVEDVTLIQGSSQISSVEGEFFMLLNVLFMWHSHVYVGLSIIFVMLSQFGYSTW